MAPRPTLEELKKVSGGMGSVDGGSWKNIASATEADLRRKGMTLDMDINPEINGLQAFGEVPDNIAPVPLKQASYSQPEHQQYQPKDAADNSIDFAIDVCMEALDAAKKVILARTGQRADLRMLVREVAEESMQEFLQDIER